MSKWNRLKVVRTAREAAAFKEEFEAEGKIIRIRALRWSHGWIGVYEIPEAV